MKKIILLLSAVLLWALPVSVSAQNKNNDKAKQFLLVMHQLFL